MGQPLFLLENPVQNYAWGSLTAIADLLGRPSPNGLPEAELWIGAHPKAPSRILEPAGAGTLDQAIHKAPVALLGPEVCDRFGNELPFLLKVLAAAEPLSIQAHPNPEQARRGWTRENEEGIRCVGAPIMDHRGQVAGAISLSGSNVSMTLERARRDLGPRVRETAKRLSRAIGWDEHRPVREGGVP